MTQLLLVIVVGIGIFFVFKLHELLKERSSSTMELQLLREELQKSLFEQRTSIDRRLEASTSNLMEVSKSMAEVKESNKKIHDLGKDIASLSSILKSPKLRGNLGEFLLEELLKTYLHPEQFTLQYGFPGGEKVDACVHLSSEKQLCIDSKFPLENFEKYQNTTEENEKDLYYRQFLRDVKKHIDAIANKYIRPELGTFDFALMYIPAESIYYDLVASGRETSIASYAFEKRVIPVSPSTLFTYIQILLLGFKGLQVEKHAETILSNITHLQRYIGQFETEFEKLGKHLGNAQGSYESSSKALSKVNLVSRSMEKFQEDLPNRNHTTLSRMQEDVEVRVL